MAQGEFEEASLLAKDVALVIEGGGTRNSYTAACIDQLLAHDIHFGWVGGISAGSSHTLNFLSGDRDRTRRSFVEFSADPKSGGIKSFLKGTGMFNAEYIYETAGKAGNDLPFDFDAFFSNPTPYRLGALRADTGETVYWGRDDDPSPELLMKWVRASSTLPGLMPIPWIDGVPYVDGAMGKSGGIPLDAAIDDGFEKFLILGTKPRGWVRPPLRSPQLLKAVLRKWPAVFDAAETRHLRYNKTREKMAELEKEGKALTFYPENMLVQNTERRLSKLQENYRLGMEQTKRDFPSWLEFLEG